MAGKGRTHSPSPRRAAGAALRGEGLARGRKASGAQRSGGEGAFQDGAHPETPPHLRPSGSLPRPLQADAALSPRRGERRTAVAPSENLILLGEFGRAHGLDGEVRLKSFTADPAAIARYGPLVDGEGRRLVLKAVRPAGGTSPDMLIARVEGVAARAAAEALNGVRLYVERDRLPPPEEEEFFLADLIGLAVEDTAGQAVGTVVAVPNYGAGDLLEIAPAGGGASALLPFTEAFAPVVDPAGKRIVIDPPEGLFEPDPAGP